jgi:UDP-N-acetylmuramyl tripeptide synthase
VSAPVLPDRPTDGLATAGSPLPFRSSVAVASLLTVNRLSRALGRGSGTVAGGRVGLGIDPALLTSLAAGRTVAVVSGTNGKTTTTRMLVAALTGPDSGPVATNGTGSNMPAGHVAALVEARDARAVVLEVDEGYLGRVVEATSPRVIVLLNLSRDQLDRIAEVRMLAERWRSALAAHPTTPAGRPAPTVVANADDPMVVWAASSAPDVRWVGAGQVWHHDAVGCPACGGRIEFHDAVEGPRRGGWWCDRCDFARPPLDASLDGTTLMLADGQHLPVELSLPGQFNRANAAMVAVAAPVMDLALSPREPPLTVAGALVRMASVAEVAGRFSSTLRSGHPVRLLLAKNPAGWTAIIGLLDETSPAGTPVVVSINARTADGFDPSWLWDVPFERLAGRPVVVTGDRYRDLAVRFRYAEVACQAVADPVAAVDRAVAGSPTPDGPVDVLGNYTAFADLRGRL